MKISIVDYGMGNLFSVVRALEVCGVETELVTDRAQIQGAQSLILPGVGAFSDGMRELNNRNLVPAIQEYIKRDRPFLGICLGMQMMMEVGEEFGEHRGLGIIEGKVSMIPHKNKKGLRVRVPHIGWNTLYQKNTDTSWYKTPLQDFASDFSVYFVHSYSVVPRSESACLAYTDYEGLPLVAAVKKGKAYGFQFHPERSGEIGLNILRKFTALLRAE